MLYFDKICALLTALDAGELQIEAAVFPRSREFGVVSNAFKCFPQYFLELAPFDLREDLGMFRDKADQRAHSATNDVFVGRIGSLGLALL